MISAIVKQRIFLGSVRAAQRWCTN